MARNLLSLRSYTRNAQGPHPLERSPSHEKQRPNTRRESNLSNEFHDKRRSRREEPRRSCKKDANQTHRRKVSQASRALVIAPDHITLTLDTVHQPIRRIQLGIPVETSILVSLLSPYPVSTDASALDTSAIIAVASLVAETRDGNPVPLEPGFLSGDKLLDTIQNVAGGYVVEGVHERPYKAVVGQVSFRGLVIRSVGLFRIRTTLIKMGTYDGDESRSVMAIDSDVIQVERRGPLTASLRRQHQLHT